MNCVNEGLDWTQMINLS